MKKISFERAYWLSCLAFFIVPFLILHYLWSSQYVKFPRRPVAPQWGHSYLSGYGIAGANGLCDYPLFRFGVFGFQDRIREADVLLFGTSHVEFGISARELSNLLSVAHGKRVRVFNLGLTGTNIDVIGTLIESNHLYDKCAIIDVFALNEPMWAAGQVGFWRIAIRLLGLMYGFQDPGRNFGETGFWMISCPIYILRATGALL